MKNSKKDINCIEWSEELSDLVLSIKDKTPYNIWVGAGLLPENVVAHMMANENLTLQISPRFVKSAYREAYSRKRYDFICALLKCRYGIKCLHIITNRMKAAELKEFLEYPKMAESIFDSCKKYRELVYAMNLAKSISKKKGYDDLATRLISETASVKGCNMTMVEKELSQFILGNKTNHLLKPIQDRLYVTLGYIEKIKHYKNYNECLEFMFANRIRCNGEWLDSDSFGTCLLLHGRCYTFEKGKASIIDEHVARNC